MGQMVRLQHNIGAVSLSLQFRAERASKRLTPTYTRADRLLPDGYVLQTLICRNYLFYCIPTERLRKSQISTDTREKTWSYPHPIHSYLQPLGLTIQAGNSLSGPSKEGVQAVNFI